MALPAGTHDELKATFTGEPTEAQLLRRCSLTVAIPQPSGEESLNVASVQGAATVCLYESLRQRSSVSILRSSAALSAIRARLPHRPDQRHGRLCRARFQCHAGRGPFDVVPDDHTQVGHTTAGWHADKLAGSRQAP